MSSSGKLQQYVGIANMSPLLHDESIMRIERQQTAFFRNDTSHLYAYKEIEEKEAWVTSSTDPTSDKTLFLSVNRLSEWKKARLNEDVTMSYRGKKKEFHATDYYRAHRSYREGCTPYYSSNCRYHVVSTPRLPHDHKVPSVFFLLFFFLPRAFPGHSSDLAWR